MPTPSEIQTCIDNLTTSSEPLDFTLLAAETSNANTGISFSVATVNDLPDLETASIGPGQIFFVESIGVPVVSTENEWKGLDGRLLRRDFIVRSLFAWGCNSTFALGNGTSVHSCSPVREFCSAADWSQVSVGGSHTAAVKTSGQLWAWGYNESGRLGDGTTVPKCSPVREICSATDWSQVSVGGSITTAIKTTGELWTWGSNACGRLGDGTLTNRCSPVREFCSATDWCQVTVSAQTAAVKTSGQLWVWGRNFCGSLGDGTTVSRCSPVREFCSATDWCQVSVNSTFTSAVKTSGQIWVWGLGTSGRLGDGTTVLKCSPVREYCSATDWCQVSAGSLHGAAIKTTGEIWAWGEGGNGRLGTGTIVDRCSPVREFCSATDWGGVSTGCAHTAAIKTSGEIWAWGLNSCGRLGDGTTVDKCSPVREFCSATDWCQVCVGDHHTAAIRSIL